MKITAVKTIVTCPGRNYVIVKIETDQDGLVGLGDATLNGRELAVAEAIDKHIAPLLLGKDPDRIEDTWQYIFRGTYWRGGPVLMSALAGIDMALWDIKGKVAGLPVYSLLGGKCRDRVLSYIHVSGEDFREVKDNVVKAMEQGFKAIRVQVTIPGCEGTYGVRGSMHEWPLQEVWEPRPYLKTIPKLFEYLRSELGEDVELLHDSHERLTPVEAGQLARELEPFHLFYLEDLLRPEHKESFRVVRQYSTTPLAMGELFTSKWDCLPLITEQLVDFIRCCPVHIGGITEARKVAALAELYHVRTAWHGPSDITPIAHAANVHLDYAIPNFGIQEYRESPQPGAVQEVIHGGPTFEDGYLMISDAPGLGCGLDEKAAAKYPYRRQYLPTPRRRDGSVLDY